MDSPGDPPRMEPRDVERLADLADAVGAASDRIVVFRALRDFLAATAPFHGVLISLYDPETRLRTLVYNASRETEFAVDHLEPRGPAPSPHSVAVETGEIVVVGDLQREIAPRPSVFIGGEEDPRLCQSAIAVPMMARGRVIGGFEVQALEPDAFDVGDQAAMRLAGNLAAVALDHLQSLERERESRREAERTRRRYEDLVEGLDAVLWEADVVEDDDPSGAFVRFTYVSRQVESMLGHPPERWIEDPDFWVSIIHPEDRETAVRVCRQATGRREDHVFEYRVVRPDGSERHVREVVSVDDREDGPPRLRGIILDVTEAKRLETHLLEAGKMEVVGRLAGGVAHDFNNLLTVIRGNVDLLLRDRADDDPLVERMEEVSEAASRAAALIRRLLAFSSRRPKRVRTLAINESIDDVAGLLRRMVGEEVAIWFDLDPDAGAIRADPTQIEQAVINLVVNARDATPEGGSIQVATRRVDDAVELVVADKGAGMDEETRAHLFEPFFTTKEGGTGLGLSTVYAVVTESGGSIDVESAPGEGTTFVLRWPAAEGSPDQPPTVTVGETAGGSGERILVAEDEPGVRRLARRVLEGAGYAVFEAPDGLAALEWLERSEAPPDLLLTDVVMPGMGGRELAELVRDRWPRLPILYMSGYHEDARLREGIPEESRLLEKPFRPEALLYRVRRALDRGPRASAI